jgi:hypothetical protein
MVQGVDDGEAMMAEWLGEQGYRFDFEPGDWGVPTNPDFRVLLPEGPVAIEVESVEGWGIFTGLGPGGPTRQRPMREALKPLRSQLRHAAKQLKPLAGTGMPLVVAVANPGRRPVPFSADAMVAAMYGDPEHVLGADGSSQVLVGRNGKLTNDHPYLSAVMVLRKGTEVRAAERRWVDENYRRFGSAQEMGPELRRLEAEGAFGVERVAVDLIETASGSARLPAGFTAGELGTHWVPLPDRSGLTRLR